jgi:carbamoyltransferase
MIIWGITALGHDASITVLNKGQILFAAHSERYSRIKNDENLNNEIVEEALRFGHPDKIVWYEKPIVKKVRQAVAGQWEEVWDKNKLPKNYLKKFFEKVPPIEYALHHKSHAAAGAFTSPFKEATVVVLDAIGEFNTCSVWKYEYPNKLKKIRAENYPHSFGLLYSAFTQRCDLKPNEEEYIMMGMSAYGKPSYVNQIKNDFIESIYPFKLKSNPHVGVDDYLIKWPLGNKEHYPSHEDIACSIQAIADEVIVEYCSKAMAEVGSKNLVFMGGVALNCVSNEKLLDICDSIWIMPNPGDAGNSLGAAALGYGGVVRWDGPFLGSLIGGAYPVNEIINELEKNKICGVANGRAEFGPRALGNRSLLADPRGEEVKDKVNEIKKRQKFRPFAPAILSEHLDKYFEVNTDQSPYMQFVAKAKPETIKKFPAIIHADGTSRVQTVTKFDNPGFRQLLSSWYKKTGCPMLLNTSLNIRGEPLVNNEKHAKAFEEKYNVKVFTKGWKL